MVAEENVFGCGFNACVPLIVACGSIADHDRNAQAGTPDNEIDVQIEAIYADLSLLEVMIRTLAVVSRNKMSSGSERETVVT